MAEKDREQYRGVFTYTDEILNDFAAMYRMKTSVSPIARFAFSLIGAAGTAFFAVMMIRKGFSAEHIIPLIFFALVLVAGVAMGRRKSDGSVERYRKHYLNRKAHALLDDSGVELKLDGQKTYARSKYREVYSLLETEKTFFLEVKGRAFYIIPKDAMDGGRDDVRDFLQKKCRKNFVTYDADRVESRN